MKHLLLTFCLQFLWMGPLRAQTTDSARLECERFQAEYVAGRFLQGIVEHSPLADPARQTQESRLRHDINRLTLQRFGGSYQVDEEQGSIRFSVGGQTRE